MSAEIVAAETAKTSCHIEACKLCSWHGTKIVFSGGDNNLQIVIGRIKPNVVCKKRTPGPPWKSCSDILATMDVSLENVTFGRRGGPGVDETIPFFIQSGKSPYSFSISLHLYWTNIQKPTLSAE